MNPKNIVPLLCLADSEHKLKRGNKQYFLTAGKIYDADKDTLDKVEGLATYIYVKDDTGHWRNVNLARFSPESTLKLRQNLK